MNRLELVAEDLALTGVAEYTRWIDAGDCRGVVAIVRQDTPLTVHLLTSAEPAGPTPSGDDLDATYAPSEVVQGTTFGLTKATYWFETQRGNLVIAPHVALELSSPAGPEGTVHKAWLYLLA
jgi:hypothetical protein